MFCARQLDRRMSVIGGIDGDMFPNNGGDMFPNNPVFSSGSRWTHDVDCARWKKSSSSLRHSLIHGLIKLSLGNSFFFAPYFHFNLLVEKLAEPAHDLRLQMALCRRLRFFVASAPVQDLLLRDKDLAVAAIDGWGPNAATRQNDGAVSRGYVVQQIP